MIKNKGTKQLIRFSVPEWNFFLSQSLYVSETCFLFSDQCLDIHGYSSDKFLLIGTKQFMEFVRESSAEEIEVRLEELEAKSLSTHLWGHRYKMHEIDFDFGKFNVSQLVYHIGERYCPVVFRASRDEAEYHFRPQTVVNLL